MNDADLFSVRNPLSVPGSSKLGPDWKKNRRWARNGGEHNITSGLVTLAGEKYTDKQKHKVGQRNFFSRKRPKELRNAFFAHQEQVYFDL